MKIGITTSIGKLMAFAPVLIFTSAANAFLPGDVTIDFELGDYYNAPPSIPANLAQAGVRLPGTVGTIDYYLEEGVRHQAIPGPFGSHVHGAFTFGPPQNTTSQLAPDSGGALFKLDDDSAFSLKTWEDTFGFGSPQLAPNQDVNVRGYSADGSGFFDVVLDAATYGGATGPNLSPDFLALDFRFGNVNLVEYWFDATGRGELGPPFASVIILDNVVLGTPIVPIPAALPLFLTALLGLGKVANLSTKRLPLIRV